MDLFELQARAISELNIDPNKQVGECFCCGTELTRKNQSARSGDSCVECYMSSAKEQQVRMAQRVLEESNG